MRTNMAVAVTIIAVVQCHPALGQDGDHPVTDGFGFTYLAPDAALPGVAVYNMTVGTAASDLPRYA